MTLTEITLKLTGPINPVGESNLDTERYKNLADLCTLVKNLVTEIDDMAYINRNAKEYTVKRAAEYAQEFLTIELGITK